MKVQSYSNWCDIDCYGSPTVSHNVHPKNAISDGDKVKITWPSGWTDVTTVSVVKSRRTVSDMGTPYDMPVAKAHITIEYEGQDVIIPLCGTNVEVEKIG